MIWRSLVFAGAMLVAYHCLEPHLPRRYFYLPGQQRANHERAQHYVQNAPADASVLAGSSMANELSESILGQDCFKLTFPGGCLFTGLELVRETGRRPRLLLIESNLLMRDPDRELISETVSPWREQLRRRSPIFEEEGRPSNFVIGFTRLWLKRTVRTAQRLTGTATPPVPMEQRRVDAAALTRIMQVNRQTLDRAPSSAELARRTNQLGAIIDSLSRQGCTCVFFEMPIDPSLQHLAEPEAVRQAMRSRFPATQYHWVEFSNHQDFRTVDGIHLTPADADVVARELIASVDKIMPVK